MKYIKLFENFNTNEYTVYRGTETNSEFSGVSSAWHGAGIYFSDNKAEASLYGIVKKAIITINKPFDFTEDIHLIEKLCSIPDLKDIKYKGHTLKEINDLLKMPIDETKIELSEGNREEFKHVWYKHNGKEYVIRNKVENEYTNIPYMKSLFLSKILYEEYGIDTLPVRLMEVINPNVFTDILIKNGYDGVIADNNVLPGKEYVVFSKNQIKWIE